MGWWNECKGYELILYTGEWVLVYRHATDLRKVSNIYTSPLLCLSVCLWMYMCLLASPVFPLSFYLILFCLFFTYIYQPAYVPTQPTGIHHHPNLKLPPTITPTVPLPALRRIVLHIHEVAVVVVTFMKVAVVVLKGGVPCWRLWWCWYR